jgi:hypothetical protein
MKVVMAGLVPAIHVFSYAAKTWMPGTRPGMTIERIFINTSFTIVAARHLSREKIQACKKSSEIINLKN